MAGLEEYLDIYDGASTSSVALFISTANAGRQMSMVINGITPNNNINFFMFSDYLDQPSSGVNLIVYNRGPNVGMMQSDNCVFYHPMESDGVEYLYNQTWSASGTGGANGIVAGQVDLAMSLVNGSGYAGLFSELSTEYPRVSGSEHIVIAFWTLFCGSGELLEVERDHLFTLSSGEIVLGDVTWNDAATISLLGSLSDGNQHFVLCDFNYQGGNGQPLALVLQMPHLE